MKTTSEVAAFSPDSNVHYQNWDALVEAESNGYVVVAVINKGTYCWPWVSGPYSDKAEAERARARIKRRFKKEQPPNTTVSYFVRPAWKEIR